jgi:prepilin-type N-terminal cleavage/methylation domain-containing protein
MKQRGFTVLEMIVVMSVASVVMVVAVGWIHQSLKLGSIISKRQEHHQSLLRLARQLRDDVNRGESMVMVGDDQLLITLDDRTLRYTIEDQRLLYQSRLPDGKIALQDAFALSRTSTSRWETSEMPTWITLIVDRGGAPRPTEQSERAIKRSTDLHVRAGIGRWLQLGIAETSP